MKTEWAELLHVDDVPETLDDFLARVSRLRATITEDGALDAWVVVRVDRGAPAGFLVAYQRPDALGPPDVEQPAPADAPAPRTRWTDILARWWKGA